jgi:hypothetical protein
LGSPRLARDLILSGGRRRAEQAAAPTKSMTSVLDAGEGGGFVLDDF